MRVVIAWFCGVAACLVLVMSLPVADADTASRPAAGVSPDPGPEAHETEILEWRTARHGRLTSEHGWLTLVGLEWLREGENRIGSGEANDIRIPGGPAWWGTIVLKGNDLMFEPAAEAELTIDGKPASRTRMIPDNQGEPTVVRHENLSFYVIMRGSLALRIKDTRAPTLLAFEGVENYPIDPGWRYEARFIPADSGQTIEIANVLGQMEAMEVIGRAEFERDGRTYSLLGVREKSVDALWFLFADRTNGRETYGAGRFLYSNGMPENGRVVVDFNKSYNPPCAFNDYSTCPLPPQQNRLDLAIRAGEKGYHHD
jgi:uncharacterized protein (DUF1684 family)